MTLACRLGFMPYVLAIGMYPTCWLDALLPSYVLPNMLSWMQPWTWPAISQLVYLPLLKGVAALQYQGYTQRAGTQTRTPLRRT
jgi:hypothetical protein